MQKFTQRPAAAVAAARVSLMAVSRLKSPRAMRRARPRTPGGIGQAFSGIHVKSDNDCDCGQFSGFIVGHLMGHAERFFIHFEHSGTNRYEISGMELEWKYVDENRVGDHIWWIGDNAKFESHYPEWKQRYNVPAILCESYYKNRERWTTAERG